MNNIMHALYSQLALGKSIIIIIIIIIISTT